MKNTLVIIPTYNELENIQLMINAVLSQNENLHMLIVDDGSPDGTAQVVRDNFKEYPDRLHLEERHSKQGLGTAYIHGFKWALKRGYEFIFEMDADFSHDPNDIKDLYNICAINGADLSIGSRYVKGVNVVNWPMSRVLLSYFASKYVRFITRMDIHDTTAGFVCYRASLLSKINLDKIKFVGYAFQIEMKFKSFLLDAKIIELPVIFTDRSRGQSKMSGGIIQEAVTGVLIMKIKSLLGKLEI
ncbi:dolichol-phosphate mannosyltransferase [Nonlabens dokdonensis]|jgi:dolichol-phosphate mannosyltransferase|uniref:Dolichol-phosphate mannosyltransferase n=2 Tax=Nonlabens dokdonensis TaxID=328515 RepID=L7WBB6_NONDD|nr:polyprenol monophosphomannose synthase [Nonlabens dokdonensis]AGC76188.1 dolichol-phosphate mannosyltransferase [Nonlabens dokdonensis DSW-6]PZX43857.1 dolichol-phosphate mannosyltransferase [Nonlabens dokdonensis]